MPPWRLAEGLLQHRFHQEVAEIIQLERQEARIQGVAAVPSSQCAQEMALLVHTFSGDGLFSFSACHALGSGQFFFPKSTELPDPPCALPGNAAWPGSSCDILLPAYEGFSPRAPRVGRVFVAVRTGTYPDSEQGQFLNLQGRKPIVFSTHCLLEGGCKQSLCLKTSKQLIIR